MTQPCPNTETFQKKTYINIDINTSKPKSSNYGGAITEPMVSYIQIHMHLRLYAYTNKQAIIFKYRNIKKKNYINININTSN